MDVKVMSIYLLLSRVKSNLYSFKVLQISNVVVTKIRIVLYSRIDHIEGHMNEVGDEMHIGLGATAPGIIMETPFIREAQEK